MGMSDLGGSVHLLYLACNTQARQCIQKVNQMREIHVVAMEE